jgi:DNA-binding MarR family transcriptional regulator
LIQRLPGPYHQIAEGFCPRSAGREQNVADFDFEQSVGCWIAQTSHAMRRALDYELSREGITFRQWEVLAWSASTEALSQAELAERMGIEAPTLAGILARMERDGWLDRSCCLKDRRKKRFRPSAKAEEFWSRMLHCCHTVRGRATVGLSPSDLATLKRVCETIRSNLSEVPDSVDETLPVDAALDCNGFATNGLSQHEPLRELPTRATS